MSIYNLNESKSKNPFVKAFQSTKIKSYTNLQTDKETSTKIPEYTNSNSNIENNNNNENKSDDKIIDKTRNKPKHYHHCFQETTSPINLFLMQDDRGSVEEIYNPLLEIRSHKVPLPKFNLKKKDKKIKFFSNINLNSDEKNVIDINKQLIQNLNDEMEVMNSKPEHFIPFNSTNNFHKIPIKNNEVQDKKMKQIHKISPLIYEKLKKTKKNLPYLFKNIQNAIDNKGINKNKNTAVINLKDVLIMHNSTVRRSVSQFKVKNYSFRQSLKLKNRPVYSAYKERFHPFTINENFINNTMNLNEVYL
jgi:hypothetical protein